MTALPASLGFRWRMPTPKDDLKDRLARYRQIKISVIGRKSGQTISIPVWFAPEGEKLYLLPVQGSDKSTGIAKERTVMYAESTTQVTHSQKATLRYTGTPRVRHERFTQWSSGST